MQPHAPIEHGHEGDGQHQRDGDRDDQARPDVDAQRPSVQAQRDEADGQHDDDGLDQHMHKLANRGRNRLGLILHLFETNARRQVALDVLHGQAQGLAHRDDVATLGHRHAQGEHLLTVVAHQRRRRVDVLAFDIGDVAQAHLTGRAGLRVDPANRHLGQRLRRRELPLHADLEVRAAGIQHTRTFDGVLRADLVDDLTEIEAQLGEPLLRNLDEELLRLDAKYLDLGHILDLQQGLAHAIGVLAQLLAAEAVGRQRVDGAVDVAEVVVEDRPQHALRQRGTHVVDLLAYLVEGVRHVLGGRVVLELEQGQRLAGLGVRADLVRMVHLLQRLLDLVGDLVGHLLGRRAGPEGLDDHDAEGERWVLVLAQLKVGREAHQHQHNHQIARQRRVFERPARDVEAFSHCGLVRGDVHARPRLSEKLREPQVPRRQSSAAAHSA